MARLAAYFRLAITLEALRMSDLTTHRGNSTATTNKRRSERVVLTVRLVISVKTADGRIVNKDAKTEVVNAHGGLLICDLFIMAGETIVLTNPRSGASEVCRVVRCEKSDSEDVAVAFQFEKPTPSFWPISFPPSDWTGLDV